MPGGFVDENESLDVAAARELEEETSVKSSDVLLQQVHYNTHTRKPEHVFISLEVPPHARIKCCSKTMHMALVLEKQTR